MATVGELYKRSVTGKGAEREYLIEDASDEDAALSAMLTFAPDEINGHPRKDRECSADEIEGRDGDWFGRCIYRSGTSNSSNAPIEQGDSRFRFDTTGGTQRIYQALYGQDVYDSSGILGADPFKGAIGVGSDGRVSGVDVTIPVYSFNETHVLSDAEVTLAYKNTLFGLTGKSNNADFRGLSAEECLFLGASGEQGGDGEDWTIDFYFAASPELSNLTVGDITVTTKKGWEYLWIYYQAVEDATNNVLVQQPKFAAVASVIDTDDFSGLGIGT